MLEKTLWHLFLTTGDIGIYLYYKSLEEGNKEAKISERVLLDT